MRLPLRALAIPLAMSALALVASPTDKPISKQAAPSSASDKAKRNQKIVDAISLIEEALKADEGAVALRYISSIPKGTPLVNHEGVPLLVIAAKHGNYGVFHELCSHGAQVDDATSEGITGLMVACAEGNAWMVDLLLKDGANPKAEDKEQHPVMAYAVLPDNPEILDLLFKAGVDLKTPLPKAYLPLRFTAAQLKSPKALAWLIGKLGMPQGEELAETVTLALSQEQPELLAFLLGKDPTLKDMNSLANSAAGGGRIGHLDLLASLGVPLTKDCLNSALRGGHIACARWLMAKGLKLEQPAPADSSPLLWAATAGQADMVAFLLASGADAQALTGTGMNALDLAEEGGHRDIAHLLKAAGVQHTGKALHWERSLDAALLRAKTENKPIFLDLWAEWCGPCHKLKRETLPADEVRGALRGMVPLSVRVQDEGRHGNPEGETLSKRYKLRAFPTLLVLDAEGKELRRFEGFMSPATMKAFLEGKVPSA